MCDILCLVRFKNPLKHSGQISIESGQVLGYLAWVGESMGLYNYPKFKKKVLARTNMKKILYGCDYTLFLTCAHMSGTAKLN